MSTTEGTSTAVGGSALSDGLGPLVIDAELPRGAIGAPCACGGYADSVLTTADEDDKYGCGRPYCCCGAFKCRVCGRRLVARFPAPEMD